MCAGCWTGWVSAEQLNSSCTCVKAQYTYANWQVNNSLGNYLTFTTAAKKGSEFENGFLHRTWTMAIARGAVAVIAGPCVAAERHPGRPGIRASWLESSVERAAPGRRGSANYPCTCKAGDGASALAGTCCCGPTCICSTSAGSGGAGSATQISHPWRTRREDQGSRCKSYGLQKQARLEAHSRCKTKECAACIAFASSRRTSARKKAARRQLADRA